MAPINDTDLFLIEDPSEVSKKIAASKLRDNLSAGTYDNHKLLVNTDTFASRWVYTQDLQTNLLEDHWMLVFRPDDPNDENSDGVSYRVSGTDVHDYFPSGPAGGTGAITDSHPVPIENGGTGTHNLTVEALAEPNFADNEAIRMVDINGITASYEPETSTIASVFSGAEITYSCGYLPTDYTEEKLQTAQQMLDRLNTYASGKGQDLYNLVRNEQTNIPVGTKPNPKLNWGSGTSGVRNGDQVIYKFSRACRVTYSRFQQNNATGNLWWLVGSNDGINWYMAAESDDGKIPGPYPDTFDNSRKYSDAEYTYYIFSYNWNRNAADTDNYFLDTGDLVNEAYLTLTDPCPDLKFFQPGDFVQGVPAWTETDGINGKMAIANGYLMTAGNRKHWRTSDGINWTEFTAAIPSQSIAYCYGDTWFAGATNNVEISNDNGQTWQAQQSGTPPTGEFAACAYGDGRFVVIDKNSDKVWYSENFANWNSRTLPSGNGSVQRMKYENGIFMAASTQGKFFRSTDGINWELAGATTNGASYINGLVFRNGVWVAIAGGPGAVAWVHYSTDNGTSWTSVELTSSSGNSSNSAVVVYGDGHWFVYKEWGQMWQSDGDNLNSWTYKGVFRDDAGVREGEYFNGIYLLTEPRLYSSPTGLPEYNPADVVSRDPVALTMTVNGGAWTGQDGTSSGNAADRETKVTGPFKSGTGKCNGVPGTTTFSVKDSNGEWIDNTNRLSEQFYVKNNSGRVSIARLLEAAIAQASVWQSGTGYSKGAFVQHDGNYWLALSSSYGNSPDDNDPLDWLKLSQN